MQNGFWNPPQGESWRRNIPDIDQLNYNGGTGGHRRYGQQTDGIVPPNYGSNLPPYMGGMQPQGVGQGSAYGSMPQMGNPSAMQPGMQQPYEYENLTPQYESPQSAGSAGIDYGNQSPYGPFIPQGYGSQASGQLSSGQSGLGGLWGRQPSGSSAYGGWKGWGK